MNILCIDTCGLKYSVAVLRNEVILREFVSQNDHMQCEELIMKIEEILADLHIVYSDFSIVAVTSGPGSFNGVRIGMSAAYGISIAQNIEIACVSTLHVMAYKANATRVLFKADDQIGFLQEFDCECRPITNIQQVTLNDCTDKKIVKFDVNNFDIDDSNISNAAAAGKIVLSNLQQKEVLFYGKPPSIHKK